MLACNKTGCELWSDWGGMLLDADKLTMFKDQLSTLARNALPYAVVQTFNKRDYTKLSGTATLTAVATKTIAGALSAYTSAVVSTRVMCMGSGGCSVTLESHNARTTLKYEADNKTVGEDDGKCGTWGYKGRTETITFKRWLELEIHYCNGMISKSDNSWEIKYS